LCIPQPFIQSSDHVSPILDHSAEEGPSLVVLRYQPSGPLDLLRELDPLEVVILSRRRQSAPRSSAIGSMLSGIEPSRGYPQP
jgi:hypothetical protein